MTLKRGFLFALIGLMIIGILGNSSGAAAHPAMAASDPTTLLYPRVVEQVRPYSGYTGVESLQVSGSWLGYVSTQQGCGHCNPHATNIALVNTLDGTHQRISAATWGWLYSSGGAPVGLVVSSFHFAWPYVIWQQPGHDTPQGYQYQAGDVDCTVCYYDMGMKTGGTPAGLTKLDPDGKGKIRLLDVNSDAVALLTVEGTAHDGLWQVGLKGGDPRQVSGAVAADVKEGVLTSTLDGPGAAWVEGTRLRAVHGTGGVQELAANAHNVHDAFTSVFWADDTGVWRYEWGQPITSAVRVPGVPPQYSATNGWEGPILLWTTREGERITAIHVSRPDGSVQSTFAMPVTMQIVTPVAFSHQLVAFATDVPSSGSPGVDIHAAWLTQPEPAFAATWAKADAAVARGQANRTWLWGPAPLYRGYELYGDPGRWRQVEYYDKSRMEVNDPFTDKTSPTYVTNGLLVSEMISGRIAVGDSATITVTMPCTLPVAGDPRKDNPLTPSYVTLASVASLHGDHQAANRIGAPVIDAIDVNGVLSTDAAHGNAVHYAAFVPQTSHNVPDVFWTYLQSMDATYGFNWAYVVGYPITEGYWTQMRVGGQDYPVLVQAFQRRLLTYAPTFAPEWRIQQGNVGQHYWDWRYLLNPGR